MALWYVRSGALGTGSGADWTNAKTTLEAAITAAAAGDTFYISEDHSQSASGVTLSPKGTAAAPDKYICVNHSGSVPPVSADLRTTAQINSTGTNNLQISSGFAYWYGISFRDGSGGNNPSLLFENDSGPFCQRFENCDFQQLGGAGNQNIKLGTTNGSGTAHYVEWENCTLQFSQAGGHIELTGAINWVWRRGSVVLGTAPTNLIKASNFPGAVSAIIEDVDLSGISSATLVAALNYSPHIQFVNCKLGSSTTIATNPGTDGFGATIDCIVSDSAAAGYRQERYSAQGSLVTETSITRSGGASDGVQAISWKISTTANIAWQFPFTSFPIAQWYGTTGASKTVTVELTSNSSLNNDDIWMDVEYLGASGNPQGSFVSTNRADVLASSSALTTSSATWNGTAQTNKYKLSATFTPQMAGLVRVTIRVAKASLTSVYVDPLLTIA